MRLYHRTRNDQLNACRRCIFNARHNRVKLALDRLTDLANEGSNDPEIKARIASTEGVIRRDFLGQGFKARDLFERAYELNPRHYYAVINATQLARNLEEFRKWTEIFREVVPPLEESSYESLEARCQALDQGVAYWLLLHDLALKHEEIGEIGQATSLMELVLADHTLSPPEEAGKRRWRAQKLRALDEQAEHFRETNREYFPPDERLALHEALLELECAIALDPYDAEMWNLKAAWCCRKLKRPEEALTAIDEAIRLRPHAYAKPHINKTQALWDLERDAEALVSAQEALRQAQEAGDAADQQHAEEFVEACRRPRITPSLRDFRPAFKRILRGSNRLADIENGEHEANPDEVTLGFFNRCRKRQGSPSMSYVPIMAELLSDFCSERVFQVVSSFPAMPKRFPYVPNITTLSQEAYDHCLHAALYIATHSDGVRQRDAARFLCLVFFGALEPEMVRMAYRQAILETTAAATDEMSRLDAIMREELGRIHPQLPHLIADQEPVDEEGRQRAIRTILSRFSNAVS